MSALERAMDLLQAIPENELETVCNFLQFIKLQGEGTRSFAGWQQGKDSAFGMFHEYADPERIPQEKEAFAHAMAEKHAIN